MQVGTCRGYLVEPVPHRNYKLHADTTKSFICSEAHRTGVGEASCASINVKYQVR